MQESAETSHPPAITRPHFLFLRKNLALLFLAMSIISALVYASFTFVSRLPHLSAPSAASQTLVLNGAAPWNNDSKTTAPTFDFSSSGNSTQDIAISPLFADYYSTHQAASTLGKAVTVAFSTHQGWVQFFQFRSEERRVGKGCMICM